MIVIDTGAILGLLDADDRHHGRLLEIFRASGTEWLIPWAVLPEVDHLARRRLGDAVARAFLEDIAAGRLGVEWRAAGDLERAREIDAAYAELGLGLVDAVVMAVGERLGARATVTLDERDFSAVKLAGPQEIWPRDWS